MVKPQAVVIPYIQGRPTQAFVLEHESWTMLEHLTAMIDAGVDHLRQVSSLMPKVHHEVIIGLVISVPPLTRPSSTALPKTPPSRRLTTRPVPRDIASSRNACDRSATGRANREQAGN